MYHHMFWCLADLFTEIKWKEIFWNFFLIKKIVKFVLSDCSWIIIELCALNKFWCNLSILLFSFVMFSFFQNDFLTAYFIFHQQRSFCFSNLSRSCLEFFVRIVSETDQNLIQFVKNNLKWIITVRKIW